MSTTQAIALKLEVAVIPVADVDRSKRFYGSLGWRLDADFAAGDQFRVVQFTPPGSPASIHFGKGVTSAAPGSARFYLVVSDVVAARAELISHGYAESENALLSAKSAFGTSFVDQRQKQSSLAAAGTANDQFRR